MNVIEIISIIEKNKQLAYVSKRLNKNFVHTLSNFFTLLFECYDLKDEFIFDDNHVNIFCYLIYVTDTKQESIFDYDHIIYITSFCIICYCSTDVDISTDFLNKACINRDFHNDLFGTLNIYNSFLYNIITDSAVFNDWDKN